MGLNKTKGNMYDFVTHTWNVIKGKCLLHDCKYCYMKRWKQNTIRFDEKELKINLGQGNCIFVGSSTDMFADNIPNEWIQKIIDYCEKFKFNQYIIQTKNPKRYHDFKFSSKFTLGVTIETNLYTENIVNKNCPEIYKRFLYFKLIKNRKFITIEPIMDFDLEVFLTLLKDVNPNFINIGADSGGNNLPEPSKEKIEKLIEGLKPIKVNLKKNLKRLL